MSHTAAAARAAADSSDDYDFCTASSPVRPPLDLDSLLSVWEAQADTLTHQDVAQFRMDNRKRNLRAIESPRVQSPALGPAVAIAALGTTLAASHMPPLSLTSASKAGISMPNGHQLASSMMFGRGSPTLARPSKRLALGALASPPYWTQSAPHSPSHHAQTGGHVQSYHEGIMGSDDVDASMDDIICAPAVAPNISSSSSSSNMYHTSYPQQQHLYQSQHQHSYNNQNSHNHNSHNTASMSMSVQHPPTLLYASTSMAGHHPATIATSAVYLAGGLMQTMEYLPPTPLSSQPPPPLPMPDAIMSVKSYWANESVHVYDHDLRMLP